MRWRAAQARMLSALHLKNHGLRILQPIQKHRLPPPELGKKPAVKAATVPKDQCAESQLGARNTLSAEDSWGPSLTRPQGPSGEIHSAFPDLASASARWARFGGRGRVMDLADSNRGWGRGWGSAAQGRRMVGSSSLLDLEVRSAMELDEHPREVHRRRFLRSDPSPRIPARGRRAMSVESRLDPRRSAARVIHARMRGLPEPRDEDSGAFLVEFNDGTDEAGADVHAVEGGSAGSAETADTSQDGDEEV